MNPELPESAPEPGTGHEPPAGLVRAVLLGVRDTWKEMLAEGRRGARITHDRRWREFDEKTKYRRSRGD